MRTRYLLVTMLLLLSEVVNGESFAVYEVPAVIYSKSHVSISSEAKGIVKHVLDVGAHFKKGEALFILDSSYEEKLLANFKEQKELLIQKLKNQKVIAEGYVELKQKASVSDYLLFEKQIDVLNSQNELERLKAQIKKLEDVLSKKKIFAPYDGVVIEKKAALFQRVMEGEPVIAIYNPNDLYVKANVSASRIKNPQS